MRNFMFCFSVGLTILGISLTGRLSVSAQALPVITAQPQSTNIVLGYPATFSVSATNPPLTYQWRKESVPIPGATGSALTLGGVRYTDMGTYAVVISNPNGSVASSNAFLTVIPPTAGDLDFSFNAGPINGSRIWPVALQADGKVLMGGDFTSVNGTARNNIARLNADGSLDSSFLGSASPGPQVAALQPDGKVLLGSLDYLIRLNADGSYDPTFQFNGTGFVDIFALAVQPDGRVLVGGFFSQINGTTRNAIARVNADGSLDTTFQNNMSGTQWVLSMALQPDGKVLIGGPITTVNGVSRIETARLNPDGSLDTSFVSCVTGWPSGGAHVRCLVLQADGKVLIGGCFTTTNGINLVVRANPNDGSLDPTFQSIAGDTNSYISALAVQPDGKVVIGGAFTTINGINRSGIARLNPDGSLDLTFQSGLSGANGPLYSLALQPDGKVLIGGGFSTVNGVARTCVARLYGAAGRYDTTDTDGDGFSNAFERQHGLNTEAPNFQVGTGADGPLTIERGDCYTDDVWARVLGTNDAGSASLKVSSTNGFAASNLVLIITMQDPNTNLTQSTTGTCEFGRIASLGSNSFILNQPRSNAFTVSTSQKIQVLKVPEYTDVTLTGAALGLDGVSQYVDTQAAVIPGSGEFTVECWACCPTAGNLNREILSQGDYGNSFYIGIGEDRTIRLGDTWRVTGVPFPVGAWHHLAVVKASGSTCLYIDGVLRTNRASPIANPPASTGLRIGRQSDGAGEHWQGGIDEVRIWTTARTQADLANNMRRTLTGQEPGLRAYYRFDEGAGTLVWDASPNHLNGLVTNGVGLPLGGGAKDLGTVSTNGDVWAPSGSLTCHPWNGTNGGVLAFLAHSVTLGPQGLISADAKGYRGGLNYAQTNVDGFQGESFAGSWPTRSITNNFGGGGGGGRSYRWCGNSGAGGGYGSPGVMGLVTSVNATNASDVPTMLVPAFGGSTYGTSTVARIFMGSGGGSGGQDGYDSSSPYGPDGGTNGGAGGAGGGIIICFSPVVTNQGLISASGQDGSSNVYAERGTGGGGAGGSVWLGARLETIGGSIKAVGGAGGVLDDWMGRFVAGPGGVGRVRLDVPTSGTLSPDISPAPVCRVQLASNTFPSLVWNGYLDSDNDGLDDWQELFVRGTNPSNPDTDGDGLPDGWEVQQGLNPTNAFDAVTVVPGDQLTYWQKFRYGLSTSTNDTDGDGLTDYQELFIYHTDSNNPDSNGDGITDGAAVAAGLDPLSGGHRYYYDALDRLVGVDYADGLTLLYTYDGNNNLLRQAYLARDPNSSGLPEIWEQLHGLTNSMFADTDGDGYTDGQEWWAGTDPRNANSVPADPLGPSGSNIVVNGIVFPFIPSNCVLAVGQLDGVGAEEIVVSADGNPGTNHDFLVILSQTSTSWTTQRVDVGPVGVTSLAVGRPANRDVPAIYVGLRQPGGTGSVVEVSFAAGQWTSSTLARSVDEAAYVLGVRPGRDVVVSLARTNVPAGTPYYLAFATNNWTLTRAAATASTQRGLGTTTLPGLNGLASCPVRLLDAGGLQVLGDEGLVPGNYPTWDADYARWFFLTASRLSWNAAQNYAQQFGGNLVTVTDDRLDYRLTTSFLAAAAPTNCGYWIGLSRADCSSPWQWASGAPVDFGSIGQAYPWSSGEPGCSGGLGDAVHVWTQTAGTGWDDTNRAFTAYGLGELTINGPSVTAAEPPVFRWLPWRGHSLCTGDLRLNGAASIVFAAVADQNRDNVVDAGDEFTLTEYLFDGISVFANEIQHVPLTGSALAPSYGLACVGGLYGNQQVLFTAEPDGRIFSWSGASPTAPLQRKLFNGHDQGLTWHALGAVKTLDAGQSLLGLRVNPATPDRCDVILWPPLRELPTVPDYPQTAPVTQILPQPSSGTNAAKVKIRVWDAEANPSKLTLQYQRPLATVWRPATIDLTNSLATYTTGVTHTVTWYAAVDLGLAFNDTVQLRARAQDVSLTGDWSAPVSYTVQNSVSNVPPTPVVLQGPWLQGTQFSLTISGAAGQVYSVQASTNLAVWFDRAPLLTNFTGTVPFTEPVPTNAPTRFYRAVLVQ